VPDRRTPTRRQLLAEAGVALAAAVSGCATGAPRGQAAPFDGPLDGTVKGTADGTSDMALARRAAGQAAELLATYRSTLRRHGELARVLRPLGAHHAEHLAVLAPKDPPRVGGGPVPRSRREALVALRGREQAVARSRRAATIAAASGDLARILASVAACQAQHGQILDQVLDQLLDARAQGSR
jgi:hypothetical protein